MRSGGCGLPCSPASISIGRRSSGTYNLLRTALAPLGGGTQQEVRRASWPKLGALIRFGIAPRSPTGLLHPAVGASGCLCRVTRHPTGHSNSLIPLCRWSAFVSGFRQGAVAARLGGCWLQSHQQVETARYPEPGVGGFSRDSSRVLPPSLRRTCRDCGGIGVVKERGSAAWPAVLLGVEVNIGVPIL